MKHFAEAVGGLDYDLCGYDGSRLLFRGPKAPLDGDYVAFLGGTETFGRFLETPFPALLARDLPVPCANLGAVNAGIDLYMNDSGVQDIVAHAAATVVQIVTAHNLSNRFYRVHPRRNDRFVGASSRLEDLFPEVDFTEFHFNRHMLQALARISEDRFATVVEEVQTAWLARMKRLVGLAAGPVILLWLAGRPVPPRAGCTVGSDPLFIDRLLLARLERKVAATVEVIATREACAEGTLGMIFDPDKAGAAAEMLGPRAHREAAEALRPVLLPLLTRRAG